MLVQHRGLLPFYLLLQNGAVYLAKVDPGGVLQSNNGQGQAYRAETTGGSLALYHVYGAGNDNTRAATTAKIPLYGLRSAISNGRI